MRMMLLVIPLLSTGHRLQADVKVDFFETQIRPILVERCHSCHSDKANKSKGGLKLDSREAILKGGESGPAIVAGKPTESLLIKAIRHDSSTSAMPPTGAKLNEAQIQSFEKWITDGAVYPGSGKAVANPLSHWAFQPLQTHAIPNLRDKAWPFNDVDRFLLAKMENAGLKPNPNASPEAVARRLSFVLTGLPPSIDALTTFVKQYESEPRKAVANYTDELLRSPAFGERFARHWMDLVRYADSLGHEYDYAIEGAWRYRDYLIRTFNRDVPYDRMVSEHIAGDLLTPRIVDGRNESLLATAWWNFGEAAAAPVDLPNDEAERMDNRLDVLGRTFSAITLGCARCHDHKFDPISTREYYGLFGVALAAPMHRTWANGPALDAHARKLRDLRDQIHRTRKSTNQVKPIEIALKKEHTMLGDFRKGVPNDWQLTGYADAVTPEDSARFGVAPGLWSGLLSRKMPAYLRSSQFTIEHDHVDVLIQGNDATIQVVVGNYQLIRDPIYSGLKIPVDPKKGLAWHRLYIGRWKGRKAHIEIFTGKVDAHHQILATVDTPESHFGLQAVVLSHHVDAPKLSMIPKLEPIKEDESAKPLLEEFQKLQTATPAAERFLAVAEINGSDVPPYFRGDAHKPKADRVPRKSPVVWSDPAERYSSSSGRRELAEALINPGNPLTARVMVNRLWHHVYGRGLVPSVDNFGLSGDKPSHPELLDLLADRFMKQHKWSIKSMLRELVQSHAFLLASGPAPTNDPENTLLAGYPLRRLDAESVRDAILTASGNLDRTIGGPLIPIPHNWHGAGSDSGNNYPASGPVDGKNRRSLYLAHWRNVPYAFLDIFDKPIPQNTFGRRDSSTVPAQALTLLNDPFVREQAKRWGERMAKDPRPIDERIQGMYRASFARWPSEKEFAVSRTFVGNPDGWEDLAMALINSKEFIHVP